ncbi:MAG: hypothetical protein ACP5QX_06675 [Caldisericaceae bacterium]
MRLSDNFGQICNYVLGNVSAMNSISYSLAERVSLEGEIDRGDVNTDIELQYVGPLISSFYVSQFVPFVASFSYTVTAALIIRRRQDMGHCGLVNSILKEFANYVYSLDNCIHDNFSIDVKPFDSADYAVIYEISFSWTEKV